VPLTNVFGRMVGNQRRQGWAILGVMGVLFIASVIVATGRSAWQPMPQMGLTGGQHMEGKEVRFGIVASALLRWSRRPLPAVPSMPCMTRLPHSAAWFPDQHPARRDYRWGCRRGMYGMRCCL
jgi:hypothetical protein